MNLLICNSSLGLMVEVYNAKFVPRVGDKMDIFGEPHQTIDIVIAFPSVALQKKLNKSNIDAIIYVK